MPMTYRKDGLGVGCPQPGLRPVTKERPMLTHPKRTENDYYHQQSLSRALLQLERTVLALNEADQTLADAGVGELERAAASRAQLDMYELQSWIRTEMLHNSERASTAAADEPTGPEPAPDASAPEPAPQIARAVDMLFGHEMQADLETEFGQLVAVRLVAANGDQLTATAPRLTVRAGMTLLGRPIDGEGTPWQVTMVCRSATEHDDEMRLLLEVTQVSGDNRRQAERLEIRAAITLKAIDCESLNPGDEVRGEVVNLSQSGFAFTSMSPLRAGDRLQFHGRLMGGAIDGEVRVASIRRIAGAAKIGCWFTSIDSESARVIERVLDRGAKSAPAISYSGLRAMFDQHR
jgi:PilZ domain